MRVFLPLIRDISELRAVGVRKSAISDPNSSDCIGPDGSRYISSLPWAAWIAMNVRSPSFRKRWFHTKVELPDIAVEVFPADVVVDANKSTLKHSEATFRRVCMNIAARAYSRVP